MRRSAVLVISLAVAGMGLSPAAAWAAKRPAADTTPPTLSIATPSNGASVGSPFTATGSAADNRSLASVTASLDGAAPTGTSGTSSWSWSSSQASPGAHTLRVTATDAAGNSTTKSQTVNVQSSDTTAPTVVISSPAAGAPESGTFQVSGSAADNSAVSSVSVSVDGGAPLAATGTSSWYAGLDASGWAAGTHVITARATDAAGNSATASVSVSKASATSTTTTTGPDIPLTDPAATHGLALLGRGRAASWGNVSSLLYWEESTSHVGAFFRDAVTGVTSYVSLPLDNTTGLSDAAYTMTSATDLWVFGGGGPMNLRHFTLAGGSVPTSAALVSNQSFGDSDSRQGDFLRLASGGLVAVWHQQGGSGPEGMWIAYRGPSSSTVQVTGPLTFTATSSSKQAMAQHPVDGSIWIFSNADATGTIGAAHLTEGTSGLSVDWTDGSFLTRTKYGNLGPDPENPDLAAAPDPSTGTIALAYQSATRKMFSTSPVVVTGSYPVVARFGTDASATFLQLPTYVERISSLGLVVQPGAIRLMYRPVDASTLTFDHVYTSVYRNGAWESPVLLGQLYTSYERVNFSPNRMELSTRLADGKVHVFLPS